MAIKGKVVVDVQLRGTGDADAKIRKVNRELEKTEQAGKSGSRGFSELATSIGKSALVAGGFATAVYGVANALSQAAKEGARLNRISKGFAMTLGGEAKKALEDLRQATGGIVADAELESFTNRMLGLGVPIEMVVKLLGKAGSAARRSGKDMAAAMEALAQAAEGSEGGMAQLGILVDKKAAVAQFAAEHHKLASAVTKADEAAAVLAATLRELDKQGYGQVVGSAVEQIGVEADNASAKVKSFWAEVVDGGAQAIKDDSTATKMAVANLRTYAMAAEDAYKAGRVHEAQQRAAAVITHRWAAANKEAKDRLIELGVRTGLLHGLYTQQIADLKAITEGYKNAADKAAHLAKVERDAQEAREKGLGFQSQESLRNVQRNGGSLAQHRAAAYAKAQATKEDAPAVPSHGVGRSLSSEQRAQLALRRRLAAAGVAIDSAAAKRAATAWAKHRAALGALGQVRETDLERLRRYHDEVAALEQSRAEREARLAEARRAEQQAEMDHARSVEDALARMDDAWAAQDAAKLERVRGLSDILRSASADMTDYSEVAQAAVGGLADGMQAWAEAADASGKVDAVVGGMMEVAKAAGLSRREMAAVEIIAQTAMGLGSLASYDYPAAAAHFASAAVWGYLAGTTPSSGGGGAGTTASALRRSSTRGVGAGETPGAGGPVNIYVQGAVVGDRAALGAYVADAIQDAGRAGYGQGGRY